MLAQQCDYQHHGTGGGQEDRLDIPEGWGSHGDQISSSPESPGRLWPFLLQTFEHAQGCIVLPSYRPDRLQ